MTAGHLADLLIAAAILALALGVVLARQVFTAVALFVAFGLLMGFAWVRLEALDVALTEAAIGAGLSGLLLLGAARRLARTGAPVDEKPPRRAQVVAIGIACATVTAALGAAILALPDPAPSLAPMVVASLPALDLGNPVTGVLMGFRALDTLLEAAVLALAVIGIWALTPNRAWGGAPGWTQPRATEGPLALLARLLPPFGIVVAAHVLWVGADAPGGKFQAAAILAAMWLLPWMAGLAAPPPTGAAWLRAAVAVGPLAFILAGFGGLLLEGAFLAYAPGAAKATILAVEVVLTGSIAVALALLVLGPAVAR
ncbi:hydrogenase subunit MbhD domain-containing protein [Roseomonas sp. HF4]|uniref:hydrogenase subunit MbhD domain-containing protein n=1 Tax=Roseomonas sp. HF4 TaxID=2562313 RepID=UPI0010C14DB7|nr:hydrogen gas-evolving membrane-bound hydrogenase subunit E [Roseomonas sp. HF4]